MQRISYNFFCLFLLISYLPVTGSDALESRTKTHYQKTSGIIIGAINGDRTSTIPFSAERKTKIYSYGYDKFLKYYHDKLGRITHCSPPAFLIEQAKFQIIAEKGRWSMIVEFGENGLVDGLTFADPDPTISVPMRNSKVMRLPFRGEWLVKDGGPTIEMNRHMKKSDDKLRGTVDFVMIDAQGYAFTVESDGSKNENYYAYGRDILAVADGEVVTVIDGVPDNRPYSVNLMNVSGNTIILKHADREFGLYAHLKLNSTRVKVGQKVVSGQTIAQCGNSGQSTGPHLHFGLVNTEVDSDAHGFMAYFDNVIVTRPGLKAIQNDYTPLRGDQVQSKD